MKHILIVEDLQEVRLWLETIVRSIYPDANIMLAEGVRAGNKYTTSKVDLALIDLGLPDGSGIDVLRKLKLENPTAIKVVTTVMGDDASIVAALSAGADGYLLKESEEAVLKRHLEQLAHGIPAISPSVARRIMEHFRLTGPCSSQEYHLTERETEVLRLIGNGLRNAEVATEMGIAASTVAGYIKIIYSKLGISSRAEAAWHASQLGLR